MARLQQRPPLVTEWGQGGAHFKLWPAQIQAITNLEASLAANKPRALIQMYTYMPCATLLNSENGGLGQILLVGQERGVSAWRVIQAEKTLSDDVMVTLKAQSAFGVIPELAQSAIPLEHRAAVKAAVERVLDSAFREAPISVVDQCRSAMTVLLSRWLVANTGDQTFASKDLAALARAMEAQQPPKRCAGWVGQLVALLHVRGKPNEQTSKTLRLPVEEDAEFCLHSLGFLLRELEWAAA